MSDDIGMEALTGDPASAPPACVAAGCDVALHCDGKMDEMVAVAKAVPAMIARRGGAAGAGDGHDVHAATDGLDFAEAIAKRDALLALA